MRVKFGGAKLVMDGSRFAKDKGCRFAHHLNDKKVKVDLELGEFELEMEMNEMVELCKLEGLTLKEVIGLVGNIADKAIQYKKEDSSKLRDENKSLKEELQKIREMVKK